MKLSKLRLENFRCFEALEVELHPQLTVFVAENGQGKSSMLDAIRIALWPFVSSFEQGKKGNKTAGNQIASEDVRLVKGESGDLLPQLPARIKMTGDFGSGQQKTWIRYRESEVKGAHTKDDGDAGNMKEWCAALQKKVNDPTQPGVALPLMAYLRYRTLVAAKKADRNQ